MQSIVCGAILLSILFFPSEARAVPSPDLIMGIGTILIQWISIGLIFVLGVFGTMHRLLWTLFSRSKVRFFVLVVGVPLIVIASASLLALVYQQYQGKNLTAQLQQQDMLFRSEEPENDTLSFSDEYVAPKTGERFTSQRGSVADQGAEIIEQSELTVSNVELQRLLDSGKIADMIVLDAREDIEYENGRFPNSIHIRIADLKAGKWLDLDASKTVIVLCWSGIRGKEVTEFLRSKEIDARYVEEGAQGWAENGGLWDGGISIKEAYKGKQYSRLLSCDEAQQEVSQGAFMVDSREPGRYARFHIPESASIPMLYTPSSGLDDAFAQVPQGASVITVCDGYVNCFDARVTGIELEKRGHLFLGRFTQLGCFR